MFEGLTKLEFLGLFSSGLTSFPAGIFSGLSSLFIVDFRYNPGTPFTFTAQLEAQGSGAFVVKVAEGAPLPMEVTLSTEDGILSRDTITLTSGRVTSDPITVTTDDAYAGQVQINVTSAVFDSVLARRGLNAAAGKPLYVNAPPAGSTAPATGAPTISGTAQVGETLTADTYGIADADGLTNVSYSYQWLSSRDTEIQGATGSTYTLVPADAGKTIKVRVTFTDDAGYEESVESESTAVVTASAQTDSEDEPSLRSYITVRGGRRRNQTPTTWRPASPSPGATLTTAPPVTTLTSAIAGTGGDTAHLGSAATDGSQITSSLSNVEGGGIIFDVRLYCGTEDSGRWVSSVRVPHDDGPSSEESNRRLVPGTYSSEPPLTGLTAGPGTLTPTFHSHNFDYAVPDVVSADDRLTVVATAKPDYEVVFVKDTSFSAIKTCSLWGSHSCTEWAYTDKDGNRAYPLTDADAKAPGFQVDLAADEELTIHVFRLYRTVSLGGHFYHLTVNRTPNSPATGLPTIDGTAQVGEMLTVDTSGIADADGLANVSYSYQWLSSRDTEIQGATVSTYTLVPADASKTIKVRVTFTDDVGNEESLTSEPIDVVVGTTKLAATIGTLPVRGRWPKARKSPSPCPSPTSNLTRTPPTPITSSGPTWWTPMPARGAAWALTATCTRSTKTPKPAPGPSQPRVRPGDYTVEVSISSPGNIELASATADVTVNAPGQQQQLEPPSTDATLSGLTLSGVAFGAFDSATTGYTANVANYVDETTVAPTTNDDGATYVVKLDGVADDDGVVPLSVGSNTITIEVTAEDGNATQTYTVTVTRAEPPAPGPAVAVELSPSGSVDEGTEITLTMSFANLESDSDTSDTDYIFRADVMDADACEGGGMGNDRYMYKVDEDPEIRTGSISTSCAPGDYTVEVSISSPGNVDLASATADFTVAAPAEQQQGQEPPPSTDATLSSLALSDVTLAFASSTTEYAASVADGVDETTVTPTTNDDGATYAIKLGGVTDDDGVIPFAVGSNVITIEVTAEDGNTAKTYTVTVTRAAPPLSADATLSSLGLSGVPFTFASATTSYDVNVANVVDQTTVTATANDDGASYVVKLGDAVDEDGTVELSVGANSVSVEVTAEDGEATRTYTVTVNRAKAPEPEPTDEPAPDSPPKTPDTPSGEVTGKGQVTLDWNDVAGAAYYQVRFWDATDWVELPTDDIGIVLDGSGASVSNLPEYGFYYFSVRAGNAAGLSDWSEFVTLAVPDW